MPIIAQGEQKSKGLIQIANEKRIDWNAVRAEYIAGGISQRKLAKKHGVTYAALRSRADSDGWVALRDETERRTNAETTQKVAEAAADNATLAQDFRKRLLLRLLRIEAKYPFDATEIRTHEGKNTVTFRIRDLTAAYKDLTEDLTMSESATNELLQSLIALERRAGLSD